MQKLRSLNSSHVLLYAPVVIAQDSFVQLGPIFGRDQTRWLHSVYEKSQHTQRMTSQSDWLYSSGTIFLRGTITFPSSALINLGTVKAGRRIYDLVTKKKTNLSTNWIKELITRSKFNQTITESALSRKAPVNGRQLSRWFLNNGNADAMARWVI
jgi:hypothetical protein